MLREVDPFGPEISDLVVDYDPSTLERRDVSKRSVIDRLRETRVPASAVRVAQTLRERDAHLDRDAVDGILVRSHLELQRLHEEFRVGETMRAMLAPVLALVRAHAAPPIRVVDLGCGMGYVLRWLAARGNLGDDVELIGADYNRALVTAAQRLSDEERLGCRFVTANAFDLDTPAHVVISTGVLHHFRGDALRQVFEQHELATHALAFVHADIRPSKIAPLGAWIFHQARMREPLAKFDGFWSAVRAHPTATLLDAAGRGAPSFTRATIDARPGLMSLLRIFQATIGVRSSLAADLPQVYASFGRRFEVA